MSIAASRARVRFPGVGRAAELPLVPLALGLITVAAFVLRVSQLHQSLYGDELFTHQDIVGHSLGSVVRAVHVGPENSPPLFFVLAWVSAKLGDPTVWARLPSLILGTATIPVIFALGRETVGRAPGLLAAAMVAASPFWTYYGIEARPYATMAFFVALSTFALVKAVRSSSAAWWLIYALAAAGAAYSHYTSIFVLAVQALWSFWVCRGRIREPLLANLLIALLYIPWFPHVRGNALEVIALLEPLTAHNVVTDLLRPIPGYPWAPLRAIPSFAGLAVIGTSAVLGLLALVRRYRYDPPERSRRPQLALIALLALATPVGLLLYSIVGTDLWSARGLSASVPTAALALGAMLWALPRMAREVALASVMLTLIVGTVRALTPSYVRPPFRAAAAYLDRVATPGDPVIFYPTFETLDITVQFHRRHRVIGSSPQQWRAVSAGQTAFLVIDDVLASRLRIGPPHPPRGFVQTARRKYASKVWPFTLLTYRAPNAGLPRSR